MSQPLMPSTPDHGSGQQSSSRRRRGRPQTIDEVLDAIHKIQVLLVLGIVSPQQAGIMLRANALHLSVLLRGQHSGGEQRLPIDKLAEFIELCPELVNLLEPLLTDDQINRLLHGRETDEKG
jgi:hypothetical protein